MKRVTVVSVHPDDETLGCGGTILRHLADGDEVTWIVVTTGWEPKYSRATIAAKAAEVDRVAGAYGMAQVHRLGLRATTLRELPVEAVVDAVGPAIEAARPDWIYTVHAGDVHTDHQVVFESLSIVCKPFRAAPRIERLMSFETLSSTDAAPAAQARAFLPQVHVDITPFIDQKLAIMAMFATEQQTYPLPRAAESIRALARYRGATIAREYAEAFMLIREVRDAR